jgi:acid phosphatase type 7
MRRRDRRRAHSGPAALAAALLLASAACSGTPVPESDRESDRESASESPSTGTGEPSERTRTGPTVLMGAGDIAGDMRAATATADLIREGNPDAVFTTGDNAYPDGSASDYAERYEPTWGNFKDRTYPVPGNHEYHTDDAEGYVDYFGESKVTNDEDGGLYYAWDVGNGWRAYALNSEISTTGAQLEWLRDDVAANPGQDYLMYAHHPRFTSSAEHPPSEEICPLWDVLAATGRLEIVLAGHNHHYERFAPMDCAGQAQSDGPRSFVIGSGGRDLYDFGEPQRGSEVRNNTDYGVLRLVLNESSYEWEFIASGRGQNSSDQVDMRNAGQVLDKGSADV